MGTPIEPRSDVLDGWKAIADYLGRSVRTVQRWRRLYGLPVHSVAGRGGGNVFAYVAELETWRHGSQHARADAEDARADEPTPPDPVVPPPTPRLRRHWPWLIAGAGALLLAALGMARLLGPVAQPAYWSCEQSYFVVLDLDRRELWRHDFGTVLHPEMSMSSRTYVNLEDAPPARPGPPWWMDAVQFADLDGDGNTEVLVRPIPATGVPDGELLCFDVRGHVRWRYQPTKTMRFGGRDYGAPNVRGAFIHRRAGDRDRLYVVSQHENQFPALVARVDADGRAVAEYWNAGHVDAVSFLHSEGRDFVLIGSPHNETGGAAVAIIDEARFGGTSPSENPAYRCETCPSQGPERFYVFPRTPLTPSGGYPSVGWFRTTTTADVYAAVVHRTVPNPLTQNGWNAAIDYVLGADGTVKAANILGDYREAADFLAARGVVPRTTPADAAAAAWPVLRWNGTTYERIDGPEQR